MVNGYISFLAILIVVLISACSSSRDAYEETLDVAHIAEDDIKEGGTFKATYEVLKYGLKNDSLDTRQAIAEAIFPEMNGEEARLKEEEVVAAPKKKVYCYKSLAEVSCYRQPQLGQESRLTNP